MPTIMDLCFLCTKDRNCVRVTEKIVSQVEYLLPEITIIKLCVPLRICTVCDGVLNVFSKFKQFSVERSRRLEAIIKRAQGLPLYTGSPPVVENNETSGAKPEKTEETSIKEEYVEETPLDNQMHTDRASLNPIDLLETISAEPQNQNMQLHTDTNADNTEEITIKEEQMEETSQDRLYYNKILKVECVNNSTNDDTDSQPEYNIEDESASFNTSEEVWEGSSADFKEETGEETDGNYSKSIQTDTKKITNKTKHQDELNKKLQENKEHRCNVCAKLFVSKVFLTRHMKENHKRLKNLPCTICKKVFIHKYDLNKHMDLHNGIKKFPCSMCKTSFFNNRNLKQHIKLHSERKENLTQTKNQIKDSISCPVWNKIFKHQYLVKEHLEKHSEVKDFHCDVCDISFMRKSSLINHLKTHTGVKDLQCDVCDKSFMKKYHFIRHMKVHSREKYIQCEVCNKSFTRNSSLKRHKKIHFGIKDIQCSVCNKSFTRKPDLNRHMKIHSGVKDYRCDICNKSFTQNSNLIRHIKSHFGVKDFRCDICNKLFSRKSDLNAHMKIHFGVKDFQCEVCGRSFTLKTNFNKHMKIHTGVKFQ